MHNFGDFFNIKLIIGVSVTFSTAVTLRIPPKSYVGYTCHPRPHALAQLYRLRLYIASSD